MMIRFLLGLSYKLPWQGLSTWLWNKKMDKFYEKHPREHQSD